MGQRWNLASFGINGAGDGLGMRLHVAGTSFVPNYKIIMNKPGLFTDCLILISAQ